MYILIHTYMIHIHILNHSYSVNNIAIASITNHDYMLAKEFGKISVKDL